MPGQTQFSEFGTMLKQKKQVVFVLGKRSYKGSKVNF